MHLSESFAINRTPLARRHARVHLHATDGDRRFRQRRRTLARARVLSPPKTLGQLENICKIAVRTLQHRTSALRSRDVIISSREIGGASGRRCRRRATNNYTFARRTRARSISARAGRTRARSPGQQQIAYERACVVFICKCSRHVCAAVPVLTASTTHAAGNDL